MWLFITITSVLGLALAYHVYAMYAFRRFLRTNDISICAPIRGMRIDPAGGNSLIGAYTVEHNGQELSVVFYHKTWYPSSITWEDLQIDSTTEPHSQPPN